MPKTPARMTKQRTIRLPGGLWDRLDGWMDATDGALNHSEAVRQLLLIALDAEGRRLARASSTTKKTPAPKTEDAGA